MEGNWSKREIRIVKQATLDGIPAKSIARGLHRSTKMILQMRREFGLVNPTRRPHTPAEREFVRMYYENTPTQEIAQHLQRTVSMIYNIANKLGLHKSLERIRDNARKCAKKPGHRGVAYQFKPGHVPYNKGLRRPGWAPGKMKETQFKKGERNGFAAKNWCPIGTIRKDGKGYLRIKVCEAKWGEKTGFGNMRTWPLLNRHVWEQHHGPIPPSHAVIFKDGDRSHCTIENLELVSRIELMRRNSMHNLPKELADVIQLQGALKRKLRRMDEKHDH